MADKTDKPTRPNSPSPGFKVLRKQPASKPSVAKAKIENRKLPDRVYDPKKPPKQVGGLLAAAPGFSTNTVPAPANIVELARALKNDVDLVMEFVYQNIEWTPVYGLQKGSYGTLVDGFGGSFDQSQVMIDLLREAGYTASFQLGELEMPLADAAAWLGTDEDIWAVVNLLADGGIPCEEYWTGSEWKIRFSHCFVKCEIDSTDYIFDPAMKSYSTISGMNLETALDYDGEEFMDDATDGATIDDDYVQDINRSNVRDNLATLAGNLVDYIKTNKPDASIDDVLGGRSIDLLQGPVRDTAHPYLRPATTPTTWTDIPNAYKATLNVFYDTIDETFYSPDIHGKRLTLFFNGSHEAELRLDGALIATSDPQTPDSWNSVWLEVVHPYPTTFADEGHWQTVYEGQKYLIAQAWGNAGRQMAELHRQKQMEAAFNGLDNDDEEFLGEKLSVFWHEWNTKKSWAGDVFNRMTNCVTVLHHQTGLVGLFNNVPFTDLGGIVWASSALDNNWDNVDTNDTALAMHGIAFEAGVIEQVTGAGGVSTTSLIDIASANGDKIYDGRPDNWDTDVRPNLVNYDSQTLDDIENWWLNWDWRVAIPEDGDLTQNTWNGYGYYAISPWYGAIGIIFGGANGGSGDDDYPCPPAAQPCLWGIDPNEHPPLWGEPQSGEPIGMSTGSMLYNVSDLAVGSARTPYGLEFSRSYNSANRLKSGPLGLGWSHNHQMTARVVSDGNAALGMTSPIQGAAGIAEMFVTVDLYRDLEKPLDKWVVVALANKWLLDQSRENAVQATLGNNSYRFIKLPDGSFARPLGVPFDMVDNLDGTYTATSPQKVEYNFDEEGNIDTIVYPFGMTISYTYTEGLLTGVSNGEGRALTLSYTGETLTGVSDGNGRSIAFALDVDGNLETYTDADSEDTVYEYASPGLLEKAFLPANPSSPMFINTFDSLNRVKEQKDAYNNTWKYYLAGYRAEEENPETDSQVWYLNRRGVMLRHINQVGNVRVYELDGLDRVVKITQPEGNSTEYEFDENNNVLSVTAKAKGGSGLSDIVNSFTYDPDWNKVATATDPRSKVTEFTYDEVTGKLLSVEYPEIDGKTPAVAFTWNARGQVLSKTDQTGIQSQFVYDVSTERLLSVIVNTNWLATIGGSPTASDVLTITVTDAGIGGGSKAKNYTVQGGDTLEDIAQGLADAINADSELEDLAITAKAIDKVISLNTAAGNTTSFSQSTSGGATETITLVSGLELTTEFDHDTVGNATSVTNPRGDETTFEFDNLRRLTKVTSPEPFEDFETKFTYDENGNRTKVERFAGLDEFDAPIWQTSEASYTIDNLLATVTDPGSNVTEFGYNTLRLLHTTEDATSRIVTRSYDAAKRLETVTDPGSVVQATYSYTDNGFVATVEDANTNVTEYERDGFDRLKKKIFADATFEQNTFDQYGRLTTLLTRAGDEIALDYNDLGWLIERAPDNMPTVSFEHDLAGRLKKVSTTPVGGNPASGDFEFFFDSAGRLITEKYPDAKQVQYQLDEAGNVTRLTYPDSYYVERVFDELNRLTDIKLNGAMGSALVFDYDPLSRRTKLTYENGVETDYGFEMDNDLNSLIQAFTGSSVEFTYGFNSVHELTSQAVDDATYLWHPTSGGTVNYGTASNLNQYPSVGGDPYDYDNNGCLTDNDIWEFGYDTLNQLVSADDGLTPCSYIYDPRGRQAQKDVDGTKTRYIHSGVRIIAEYDGAGDFVKRYVYGTGLDEVLLEVDDLDEVTSLHHDRVGSIIATTNDTGVVLNSYAYSPWGECDDMSGTAFGFQGQRFDHETGLYFMKARHYDPRIGRFLQPDPIGYADGLNEYKFGYNNPNNFRDPLGLAADPNNRPWGTPDPNYEPPRPWGVPDPNYNPPTPWGAGYQYGNYHVGYDGGATIDIRLDDGTIIIVDVDAGGLITDVTPGHPGAVAIDLSNPPASIGLASNTNSQTGIWQKQPDKVGYYAKWINRGVNPDGSLKGYWEWHYTDIYGQEWVYRDNAWWMRTGEGGGGGTPGGSYPDWNTNPMVPVPPDIQNSPPWNDYGNIA